MHDTKKNAEAFVDKTDPARETQYTKMIVPTNRNVKAGIVVSKKD